MSTRKRLAISFILGTIFTVVLIVIGYTTQSETLSRVCFWQSNLLTWLVQPGPIVGYTSDGTRQFEGNPIWLVMVFGGMASGIPIYTTCVYLILTVMFRKTRRSLLLSDIRAKVNSHKY
jgi:hypothetical protein